MENEEQDANEIAEEQAFEAGFNDEELAVEEENAEESEEVEGATEEAEAEEQPELFAGMTEDQLNERLSKADMVDQLQQDFYKLKSSMSGTIGDVVARRVAALPKPDVKFSKDLQERMFDEFPEVAEVMFGKKDDVETEENIVAPDVRPEPIEDISQQITEATEAQSKAFEQKLLLRDHPDYAKVSATPEFREFVGTLSKADQQNVDQSWDSAFLSKVFTNHKEWLETKNVADDKKAKLASVRKKRLEAAITPRGDTQVNLQSIDDEEAAMMEGFNS